jgi:flagellar biogenesis protein FliO
MSALVWRAFCRLLTPCFAFFLLLPVLPSVAAQSPSVSPTPTSTVSISSEIPVRRDQGTDGDSASSLQLGFSLVLIFLGVWVYLAFLKKRRGGSDQSAGWRNADAGAASRRNWLQWFQRSPRPTLSVQSSTHLTQGHSVHVLRWEGREYLIGCASQTIAVLASSPIQKPGDASEAQSQ